jgi:putative oxidoreductase
MQPHDLLEKGRDLAERIPQSLILLTARIAIANIFWRSAQTKINGFSIREETFFLFREEYKVPLLPPDLAAYLATAAELTLSALGLFAMTLVIQLFVIPGGWPEHLLWFALLGLIVARGPGVISLDHLISNRSSPWPAMARSKA